MDKKTIEQIQKTRDSLDFFSKDVGNLHCKLPEDHPLRQKLGHLHLELALAEVDLYTLKRDLEKESE